MSYSLNSSRMIEFSYFIACLFVIIVSCIKVLHVNSCAEWPELFVNGAEFTWRFTSDATNNEADSTSDDSFVAQILKRAPIFSKP